MANYNIITGKAQALQGIDLNAKEIADWSAYYDRIVAQKREIDPEIAKSFEAEKDFYSYAATVAKAYFSTNSLPFVPQEPTSGTYGVREILPQDIGVINWTTFLSTVHTWVVSLTVGVNSAWANLFGTIAAPVTPSNTQSFHSLLAFHSLISWQPGTRLVGLKHNVNSYGYPTVSVEESAKIEKPFKTFKLIPLEGEFMIWPTGTFNTQVQLEKVNIANSETYTENVGILGFVFAEYAYLNAQLS